MPDGMSPEKPQGVYGSADRLWQDQAANIPESAKAIRNVVDLLDDEAKKAQENMDEAIANRLYYSSRESLNTELITTAPRPLELYRGLRALEAITEDGNTPQGLSDHYTSQRIHSAMFERKQNLQLSIDTIKARGWFLVRKDRTIAYNENDGTGIPKNRRFAPLAISVNEEIDEETGKQKTEYLFGTPTERARMGEAYKDAITEFEARNIMNEHIGVRLSLRFRDSLEGLTAVMHDSMPKLKVDHLKALTGKMPSIEVLEETQFIHDEIDELSKVTVKSPEQIKRVSDLTERLGQLEAEPDLSFQLEESIFLNLVMLNSGSKTQLLEFLRKPGPRALIEKMAKQEARKRGEVVDDKDQSKTMELIEKWKLDHIGDIKKWKNDTGLKRKPDGSVIIGPDGKPVRDDRDLGKTWREEAAATLRKDLVKWANISAWAGNPSEFGIDKENGFIQDTVGGLVGIDGIEASWLAATLMRDIGAYASEGYVALPNGKSNLPLGEGRYISGDDTGKFYAYMFNMKEGLKGRSSGLKDMIGKIPDLAMNFFDWTQVEMDDLPETKPDGSPIGKDEDYKGPRIKQRRSIWDAWLGTAEQPLKSLLTGEIVGQVPDIQDPAEKKRRIEAGQIKEFTVIDPNTGLEKKILVDRWVKEEPYHPLRKLNYDSLERDVHGTFTIMQWLMGNERGPTGTFIDAMSLEFKYEDFRLNDLKKKRKYIGIIMNPVVLTKGSTQLYEDAFTAPAIIQKNFFRNLMIARIHSDTFTEGILNGTQKLFNPEGGGDAMVPNAVLVRAFVKEALKDNPVDEETLIQHYIDENGRLRKMGEGGTPGMRDDVKDLLDDGFFPEKPVELGKDASKEEKEEYQKKLRAYQFEVGHIKDVGKVTGKKKF